MTQLESPYFCPIFVEISDSFHLKAPLCPNAVFRNEEGEEISRCGKTPEECLVLNNIKADVNASATVETDLELRQEELIEKWLKEQNLNPSSLL